VSLQLKQVFIFTPQSLSRTGDVFGLNEVHINENSNENLKSSNRLALHSKSASSAGGFPTSVWQNSRVEARPEGRSSSCLQIEKSGLQHTTRATAIVATLAAQTCSA
jgi:hypothetical protein